MRNQWIAPKDYQGLRDEISGGAFLCIVLAMLLLLGFAIAGIGFLVMGAI